MQDLRRERAAAHAHQDSPLVAARPHLLSERLEFGPPHGHRVVQRQPAKAVVDLSLYLGIIRPKRSVLRQQPLEHLRLMDVAGRLVQLPASAQARETL